MLVFRGVIYIIYYIYIHLPHVFIGRWPLADWDLLHQSFYKLDMYPGRIRERYPLDVSRNIYIYIYTYHYISNKGSLVYIHYRDIHCYTHTICEALNAFLILLGSGRILISSYEIPTN